MTDNTNITAMPPTGIVESVLARVKQTEHDRDRALTRYYKSMMGQKDMSYSQTQVCRLAVEFLFRKGYTTISTSEGVRKRLVKLGVIKPET